MEIRGTTGLVTGAGSGIGQALAQGLAEAGAARVVIVDIAVDRLEETAALVSAAGAEPVSRAVDLTDFAALTALFADPAVQALDILCNNAGIVMGRPDFPDSSVDKVSSLIALNLTAVVLGTQYAVQIMRRHGRGGAIVNTASRVALTPSFLNPVYAATKAGVVMLSRSLEPLKASDNICVNAICPSIVATRLPALTGGDGTADWMASAMSKVKVMTPDVPATVALNLIRDDRTGEAVVIGNEPADT